MEELALTFNEVLKTSAQVLTEASQKYGDQAVEVGLLVYRMEALNLLLLPTLCTLLFGTLLVMFAFKWCWQILRWQNEGTDLYNERPMIWMGVVPSVLLVVFLFFKFLALTLNPFAWASVLGYPEVFIAAKALAAAGLL